MEAVGIIAEYNPFHNGHHYQLKWIREKFPQEAIIVAMSGNFLQRGEPACLDKWTRAREALIGGADLVVEVPLALCFQAADRFAMGGVQVLNQLGVNNLVFGAEHADYDFKKLAAKSMNVSWNYKRYDESYAASYQQAIKERLGFEVSQPNDLLGLAYAKAVLKLGADIDIAPLSRKDAGYHDANLDMSKKIASATAIRKQILAGKAAEVRQFISSDAFDDLTREKIVSWSDLWPLLHYRLLTATPAELDSIYGMAEGIQYRRIEQLELADPQIDFDGWLHKVKNKRFTYTRLSRLALAVLLNLRTEEVKVAMAKPYIRILGFNQQGRKYLSEQKKKVDWPLISNVNQKIKKNYLALDYRAGKLYQMMNGHEQDVKRGPIML